jgi:hypothetical protein
MVAPVIVGAARVAGAAVRTSKDMLSEKAMRHSLNQVAKTQEAILKFLSSQKESEEDSIENARAQKIKDKEEKKQTEQLEKLNDKKDKEDGFLMKWMKIIGKFILGALVIFGLLIVPMKMWSKIGDSLKSMFKQVTEFLKDPQKKMNDMIDEALKKKTDDLRKRFPKTATVLDFVAENPKTATGIAAAGTVATAYTAKKAYKVTKNAIKATGRGLLNKATGKPWGGLKPGLKPSGIPGATLTPDLKVVDPEGNPNARKPGVGESPMKTTKGTKAKIKLSNFDKTLNLIKGNLKKLTSVLKKVAITTAMAAKNLGGKAILPAAILVESGIRVGMGDKPSDALAKTLSSHTFDTISPQQIKSIVPNIIKGGKAFVRDTSDALGNVGKEGTGFKAATSFMAGNDKTYDPTKNPRNANAEYFKIPKPTTIQQGRPLADMSDKVKARVFTQLQKEQGEIPKERLGTHKLNPQDFKKIFKAMAMAESSGNISATNDRGYVGKYQFGAAALETIGYIKAGTWAKRGKRGNASLMNDRSNWVGGTDKAGNKRPSSLKEYMSNEKMQDIGMSKLALSNRAQIIKKLGKETWEGLSKKQRAFMIGGAHLSGATSMANQFKSGSFDTTDAYGTTSSHHGTLAANAVGVPNVSGQALSQLNNANIKFGGGSGASNVIVDGSVTNNITNNNGGVAVTGNTAVDKNGDVNGVTMFAHEGFN